MITIIIIGALAFFTGIGISWIILKPKLDSSEEVKNGLIGDLNDITEKFNTMQISFGDCTTKNGVLAKEVELKDLSIDDYKEQIKAKISEVNDKQNVLTIALEAKTTAETTLLDIRKHVGELLKKEYNLTQEIKGLQEKLIDVEKENAGLKSNQETTKKSIEEQQKFVESAQKNLKDAFGALSADALQHNNTSFVELAKAKLQEKVTEAKGEFEKKQQAIGELVKPLGESLKNMDSKIQDLEGKRIKAYGDIWNYLDQVKLTTEGLKKETTNLVGALKTSHSRGRYGEIGLRRLVEHAGMFENCHFEEQITVEDDSGKLRPDMIIKLPGVKF